MRALGFEVTEHVGKTGIVAIYKNGPGPTVMVRTELDALPMEEKTGLPYASHATQMWNGKPTPQKARPALCVSKQLTNYGKQLSDSQYPLRWVRVRVLATLFCVQPSR